MLLGRVRDSQPVDLRQPPIDLGIGTVWPLDAFYYANYDAELGLESEHRSLLTLKNRYSPQNEVRILVDTTRNAVLSVRTFQNGKLAVKTTFDDFLEVAGAWYAGRIETVDADGRRSSITTQKLMSLPAGQFEREWKQESAVRERTQLLREPLIRLADAKKALAAGKAGFDDQIAMLLHFQGATMGPRPWPPG